MKCIAVGLAAWLLAPAIAFAAPLPPELNVVPRDGAAFVSIRVAEVWNAPALKPLRDYLIKDARALRDFEKQNGFSFEALERATFFIAGFDGRRGPTEPVIVLTFAKPYNLPGLLDAWRGMSPDEFRREEQHRPSSRPFDGPPQFKNVETGKGFDKFPPPKDIPKPIIQPPPPPPQLPKSNVLFFGGQDAPPFAKEKHGERQRDLKAKYYILLDRGFLIPIDDRTVLIGLDRGFDERQTGIAALLASLVGGKGNGPLTPALEAAAGESMLVAGVNLPVIKSALPKESWVEVLPLHSILASRTATLVMNLGKDELALGLRIDSTDEATSKRAHDVLKAIHVLGSEMLPGLKKLAEEEGGAVRNLGELALSIVTPLIRDAQFEQKGTSALVVMKAKFDANFAKTLNEAIDQTRAAAERAQWLNNLRQIGIAVHIYNDQFNRLPFPGISAPKGQPQAAVRDPKPNLSWRVAILPFIEQDNLYKQFHLDEPWDSEHNKKLIPMMPRIFAPPRGVEAKEGHTFLRCFNGPTTISAAPSIQAIADGSSNTIMVVDAGEAVPWTKPEEIDYDPKKPLPKLGSYVKGKIAAAFGDGRAVHFDPAKMTEQNLRHLIEYNDGHNVLSP